MTCCKCSCHDTIKVSDIIKLTGVYECPLKEILKCKQKLEFFEMSKHLYARHVWPDYAIVNWIDSLKEKKENGNSNQK